MQAKHIKSLRIIMKWVMAEMSVILGLKRLRNKDESLWSSLPIMCLRSYCYMRPYIKFPTLNIRSTYNYLE